LIEARLLTRKSCLVAQGKHLNQHEAGDEAANMGGVSHTTLL